MTDICKTPVFIVRIIKISVGTLEVENVGQVLIIIQ